VAPVIVLFLALWVPFLLPRDSRLALWAAGLKGQLKASPRRGNNRNSRCPAVFADRRRASF
jgi:hypothetical protein